MIIQTRELDKFVSSPKAFEELINDLIRAEARLCTISPTSIDWDERVNVPDGGRDIVVKEGSSNKKRRYLPSIPSIWSIKSGKDGLEAISLENEIKEHPEVIKHLNSGGKYFWCTIVDASYEKRQSLESRAQEVATELGFSADLIEFFFKDHIYDWIKDHPGILLKHFDLKTRALNLETWSRLVNDHDVEWVNFAERDKLVERIQAFMSNTDSERLIYIVGRSGIGKTRTTYKACQESSLQSVIYYQSYEDFQQEDYLYSVSLNLTAIIVIDDVQIEDYGRLESAMGKFGKHIKIVAIGPSTKNNVEGYRGIIEVPEPKNADVESVIKAKLSTADSADITRLAALCDNDLRLALLICDMWRDDRSLINSFNRLNQIWTRILELSSNSIGDLHRFKEGYEILALCLDVGNMGTHVDELKFLASYFGKEVTNLNRAINQAINCSLGKQQGRFFEPSPAALARWIFESASWPLVKNNAVEFLDQMPSERMMRRFIERSYECSDSVKEEVNSALAEWFRGKFPSPDISLINDREASRTFFSYTELDPDRGLYWLKTAVNAAFPEQLLMFDGNPDGSGGWRGRRQVVWLCSQFACFEEYFWICEEILYKLALCETEHDIGNNSTGVWEGLFLPIFSGSTIPFERRFSFLLKKLQTANEEEVELIFGAIKGALIVPSGRLAPPRVVGGRLVPQEKFPKTNLDLFEMQKFAAENTVAVIKDQPILKRTQMLDLIIPHVVSFLRLGCMDELEKLYSNYSEDREEIRALRTVLSNHLSHIRLQMERNNKEYNLDYVQKLTSWIDSLSPESLSGKVKEVTGRAYWDHYRQVRDGEKHAEIYRLLAIEVLNSFFIIDELSDWFGTSDPQSTGYFGYWLGREDRDVLLEEIMNKMILDGVNKELVGGYLSGLQSQYDVTNETLSAALQNSLLEYPRYVAEVTLVGKECSSEGFNRVCEGLLLSDPKSEPSLLVPIVLQQGWSEFLTENERIQLLELLLTLSDKGDRSAIRIAIDIIALWFLECEQIDSEQLVELSIRILTNALQGEVPLESWNWNQVVSKIPESHIVDKIDLCVNALVNKKILALRDEVLKTLIKEAPIYPVLVMEKLGERMMDGETRYLFMVYAYRGLFEAIGLESIQLWLDDAGEKGAIAMARHLESPFPKEFDETYVPPVTEWILAEFEGSDRVFNEFCAGRHAYIVFWENELKELLESKEVTLKPYFTHHLRRIREWAKYELSSLRNQVKFNERIDAEQERL